MAFQSVRKLLSSSHHALPAAQWSRPVYINSLGESELPVSCLHIHPQKAQPQKFDVVSKELMINTEVLVPTSLRSQADADNSDHSTLNFGHDKLSRICVTFRRQDGGNSAAGNSSARHATPNGTGDNDASKGTSTASYSAYITRCRVVNHTSHTWWKVGVVSEFV